MLIDVKICFTISLHFFLGCLFLQLEDMLWMEVDESSKTQNLLQSNNLTFSCKFNIIVALLPN